MVAACFGVGLRRARSLSRMISNPIVARRDQCVVQPCHPRVFLIVGLMAKPGTRPIVMPWKSAICFRRPDRPGRRRSGERGWSRRRGSPAGHLGCRNPWRLERRLQGRGSWSCEYEPGFLSSQRVRVHADSGERVGRGRRHNGTTEWKSVPQSDRGQSDLTNLSVTALTRK